MVVLEGCRQWFSVLFFALSKLVVSRLWFEMVLCSGFWEGFVDVL